MNLEATSETPQKEYRLTGVWRLFPWLMLAMGTGFSLVFVVLFFIAPRLDGATMVVLLVGAVIMFVLGVWLYFGLRNMRLVTSPQGVIMHGLGYRVYSPWDNITGMGEAQYGGNNAIGRAYQPSQRVEGLLLRTPALTECSLNEGIRRRLPVIEPSPLLQMINMRRYANIIPTGSFIDDTTISDLREDAERYAPQTFKKGSVLHYDNSPLFKEQ